jgi:UDP-3-O-[3-hydroxymyristoyl] glucosamine N-acyltransferase
VLHPGVVLGSDGFGMVWHQQHWVKVPQIGSVIIGDDVEIGANTTVDRGALDDTVIEQGCKLDNLIQIGHNARIGAHTAIAACVGIGGSAKIGRHCKISGGVMVRGHLSIVDHVTLTGMSMVIKDIKLPGVYSSGTPLLENRQWHKNNARYKSLDRLARTVALLEKQQDKSQ